MSFLPTDEEDARVMAELDAERRRERDEALLQQHAAILKIFRQEQAQCARELGNQREAEYWERLEQRLASRAS